MSDETGGLPTQSWEDVDPGAGRRTWLAAFLVLITVVALCAVVLWGAVAFADPSGGCGG